MCHSSRFKVFIALLLIAVTMSMAAVSKSGKVRYRVGDAFIDKKAKGNWNMITLETKVQEKDMIRTELESQVIIAMPDGSVLSVDELSLVEFSKLLNEDGVQTIVADIRSGKVRFDAQKQTDAKSYLNFKTGTAVAAIRGTSGTIGVTSRGKPIASLSNGRLEINYGNKNFTVNGGETAVPSGDELVVLQLASSGNLEFLKELDKMSEDSTKTAEELTKSIMEMDSVYSQQKQALQDSLKCSFETLPDTVNEPMVSLKGTCPAGIQVEISSERKESNGQTLQFDQSWAPDAVGEKKFPVTCYVGKVSVDCGTLKTLYVKKIEEPTPVVIDTVKKQTFQVFTQSPVKICETGALTVEGTFDPTDTSATLIVKLGNKASSNLIPISAEGKFSYTISINDTERNWNHKQALVEYQGRDGRETRTIDLDIDKTCSAVNKGKPLVEFQGYDSLHCVANYYVKGATDDKVVVSSEMDGSLLKEVSFEKDGSSKIKLAAGIHKYKVLATDQAGNKGSMERSLGCYLKHRSTLNLGASYERLRVPPPPNRTKASFYKTMRFSIENVLNQNPQMIKRVVVKQGNNVVLRLVDNQITDLHYDVQVELKYGKRNDIRVEVLMKNGQVLKGTKTYEVR